MITQFPYPPKYSANFILPGKTEYIFSPILVPMSIPLCIVSIFLVIGSVRLPKLDVITPLLSGLEVFTVKRRGISSVENA